MLLLGLPLLIVQNEETALASAGTQAEPGLKWTRSLGAVVRESSPLAIDLDGQGSAIMVGNHDGKLYGLRGANGADVPGWPRQFAQIVNSSPSAADTDGDGRPEVFVGSENTTNSCGSNGLHSFRNDGTTRFIFQAADEACTAPSISASPALGDVNGDGVVDVTFANTSLKLWSLNHEGIVNQGWPFYADDSAHASAALADINNDGQTDVIIAHGSTEGGPVDHRGGIVWAFSGDGRLLWQFRTNEAFRSSPSIGDVDGDGQLDIVVGSGDHWVRRQAGVTDATRVFVLNANGTLKWSRDTGAYPIASPTLADFNGDGVLDIAIGTFEGPTPGRVLAWKGNGDALPGFPRSSLAGVVIGQISTADLNGDGGQDMLVPTGGGVFAFNGKTGAKMFGLLEGQAGFQNTPLVTDIDANGLLDIIIAGGTPGNEGKVWRYEMAAGANASLGPLGWHTFRKDARRTGSWTNPPLTQPLRQANNGYWMAASDGGMFTYRDAPYKGSTGNLRLNSPIVDMAPTPSGNGYWLVAADGGIFTFGDAQFFGSKGGSRLNKPIVSMAASPSGNGYWLVAADGGIFTFGEATYRGGTGNIRLNSPIVDMVPTPTGIGYYLVAADGGIFSYGDAIFRGSTGNIRLNQPIVGMSRSPRGDGYWLVASDGGIFTFGDARFMGSTGAIRLNQPIVGMSRTKSGNGYWLVAADGGIFTFGDAPYWGSAGAIKLNQPIVAMGARW